MISSNFLFSWPNHSNLDQTTWNKSNMLILIDSFWLDKQIVLNDHWISTSTLISTQETSETRTPLLPGFGFLKSTMDPTQSYFTTRASQTPITPWPTPQIEVALTTIPLNGCKQTGYHLFHACQRLRKLRLYGNGHLGMSHKVFPDAKVLYYAQHKKQWWWCCCCWCCCMSSTSVFQNYSSKWRSRLQKCLWVLIFRCKNDFRIGSLS